MNFFLEALTAAGTAAGKTKASHKIWITVDNYFMKIYKMMSLNIAFEVTLKEGNFQYFSF